MDEDRRGSGSGPPAATRDVVLDHVDAFNAHDTDRLIAGLHHDIVWATGSDAFRGTSAVRGLFDDTFWTMRPSLAVRALVVEGGLAAATLRETLVVDDELREFDIAVFFGVRDGRIRTLHVFREGSADIEP